MIPAPSRLLPAALCVLAIGFSGLNAPYQPPTKPRLRLDSSTMSIADEVEEIISMMKAHNLKPAPVPIGARGDLVGKP